MITTEKVKRRNSLLRFGFGADVMKGMTVCDNCNSPESSSRMFCTRCGMRLPRANLYDFYRLQHRTCKNCGTVLSDFMDFCPKCGSNNNINEEV